MENLSNTTAFWNFFREGLGGATLKQKNKKAQGLWTSPLNKFDDRIRIHVGDRLLFLDVQVVKESADGGRMQELSRKIRSDLSDQKIVDDPKFWKGKKYPYSVGIGRNWEIEDEDQWSEAVRWLLEQYARLHEIVLQVNNPGRCGDFWKFLKEEVGGFNGQEASWRWPSQWVSLENEFCDAVRIYVGDELLSIDIAVEKAWSARVLELSQRIRNDLVDQEEVADKPTNRETRYYYHSAALVRKWALADKDQWAGAANWLKKQYFRLSNIAEQTKFPDDTETLLRFWDFFKEKTGGVSGQKISWRFPVLWSDPANGFGDCIGIHAGKRLLSLDVMVKKSAEGLVRVKEFSRKICDSLGGQEVLDDPARRKTARYYYSVSLGRDWMLTDECHWDESAVWLKEHYDRLLQIAKPVPSKSECCNKVVPPSSGSTRDFWKFFKEETGGFLGQKNSLKAATQWGSVVNDFGDWIRIRAGAELLSLDITIEKSPEGLVRVEDFSRQIRSNLSDQEIVDDPSRRETEKYYYSVSIVRGWSLRDKHKWAELAFWLKDQYERLLVIARQEPLDLTAAFWRFFKKETGGVLGQKASWRRSSNWAGPVNQFQDHIRIHVGNNLLFLDIQVVEDLMDGDRAQEFSRKICRYMSHQKIIDDPKRRGGKKYPYSVSVERNWALEDEHHWPEVSQWLKDQYSRLLEIANI